MNNIQICVIPKTNLKLSIEVCNSKNDIISICEYKEAEQTILDIMDELNW